MKRKNFPGHVLARRERAQERAIERAKRSPVEQSNLLTQRRGNSVREQARLLKLWKS